MIGSSHVYDITAVSCTLVAGSKSEKESIKVDWFSLT